MFSKTAIIALLAGLVAAQHAPVGEPSGNSITRPLREIVPACKPFTITWLPTTANSVSLILVKGPSNNVVPFGPPIVVGIPNSGSFTFTPASSLEATPDNNGYGIQLIDDVTGQYQYSPQFGISKGAECNSYVTPTPSSSQYGGGYPVSTPVPSSVASSSGKPAPSSKASSTLVVVTSTHMASSHIVYSTGVPGNSTVIQPTQPITVPSSLIGSATGSATRSTAPAQQTTNAASGLQAGLGLAGAAAALAFML